MEALTSAQDLPGLVAVALMLGLRHGFDADHLAAIDGMTRFNAVERPRLARRTGLWFSLGHGAVVMGVAVSVSSMGHAWTVPAWLEPFGAWAAILVLLGLGLMNLGALRHAAPGAVMAPVGWRSGLFARLLTASGPGAILGVGALFALSFDTLGQAVLMAATGTASSGVPAVIALAGAFVLGMLITDGINGWWVARLVRRSDRMAARASRVMCIGVALASLATAALGVAMRLHAPFGAWAATHATSLGGLVVALMIVSFLVGVLVTPSKEADDKALSPSPPAGAGRSG